MTKKEQIEEMTQDFINFGITTRQGVEAFAEILYNAGYRKIDEFAECRNCSAWLGTDCTRHPYTQGCLKDETNVKEQAAEEIALLKTELKKELEEHEAFVNNMKNVLEIEKKNAVEEFAEKLKERMGERDYMGVKYKQGVFSENDIDELLKEYENE